MPAVRARIVVVVTALGVAAAAWLGGDGGGARAAIGQATGPLVATAPGDAAVLVAQNLAPGQEQAGEVTVTNAGDAAGGFALGTSGLTDAGAPLSRHRPASVLIAISSAGSPMTTMRTRRSLSAAIP